MTPRRFIPVLLHLTLAQTVLPTSIPFLYENSPCIDAQNRKGTCIQIFECPEAFSSVLYHNSHNFTRCGFVGFTEMVCCPTLRKSEEACRYYKERRPIIMCMPYGVDAVQRSEDDPCGPWYEFPSVAALGMYSEEEKAYKFRCGGTIISEKYLITAAHCLSNMENSELGIVRVGERSVPDSVTEKDPSLDMEVANCVVHPEYSPRHEFNDIALVELKTPLIFNYDRHPSCLFVGTDYPQELKIVGWGTTESSERSVILQKANVSLASFEECKQKYQKYGRLLRDTQLCAFSEDTDSCTGDSGGPLLKRFSDSAVIVGIVSFGGQGCQGRRSSVYTSVSQYLDWIEEIVWNDDLMENVDPGEFPFLVALTHKSGNYTSGCGGTIISNNHVVTAAHCFDHHQVEFAKVATTEFPLTLSKLNSKINIRVKKVTMHPSYNSTSKLNDIAVIELKKPLRFWAKIQKIRFLTNSTGFDRSQKLVVVCWKKIKVPLQPEDPIFTRFRQRYRLQKTVVFYEPFQFCKNKFEAWYKVEDGQLCATHNVSDVCEGHMGGPLITYDSEGPVLVGVSSFGRPGCFTGGTYVYTSVAKYFDWLNQVMTKI